MDTIMIYRNIYDYIIPPWDPRYDHLDVLFNKYNWNNILVDRGYYSKYWFLPHELVTHSYCSNSICIDKFDGENLIYKRELSRLLYECARLSIQDYFDLLVLHINRRSDRPKCPICNTEISFYAPYQGYGSPYISWQDKELPLCCSRSCRNYYRHQDISDWFNSEEAYNVHSHTASELWRLGIWNKDTCFDFCRAWQSSEWRSMKIKQLSDHWRSVGGSTYRDYYRYLSRGKLDDICYFYIAITPNYIKYGVTNDLDRRSYLSTVFESEPYLTIHNIYKSTRLEVANLEATIKLKYSGNEYLDKSLLHNLIIDIKNILNTNITNPFE